MVNIDPNLIRSSYIGNSIKNLLEKKDITITEISEKADISRTTLNNALNGRTNGSDNMFKKVLKAIPLNEKQIKEIFKQADREEYKYKYGEEINTSCEVPSLKVAFKKEYGKELTENDKAILDRLFKEG